MSRSVVKTRLVLCLSRSQGKLTSVALQEGQKESSWCESVTDGLELARAAGERVGQGGVSLSFYTANPSFQLSEGQGRILF